MLLYFLVKIAVKTLTYKQKTLQHTNNDVWVMFLLHIIVKWKVEILITHNLIWRTVQWYKYLITIVNIKSVVMYRYQINKQKIIMATKWMTKQDIVIFYKKIFLTESVLQLIFVGIILLCG